LCRRIEEPPCDPGRDDVQVRRECESNASGTCSLTMLWRLGAPTLETADKERITVPAPHMSHARSGSSATRQVTRLAAELLRVTQGEQLKIALG
jgi:hypothetical protein